MQVQALLDAPVVQRNPEEEPSVPSTGAAEMLSPGLVTLRALTKGTSQGCPSWWDSVLALQLTDSTSTTK